MTEAVKDFSRFTIPAALLGTTIGAFAGIKALSELPPWLVGLIETQAIGMLGFLTMLGCVVYFAPQLIGALAQQAIAMQKVGDQLQVMSGQTGKLEDIKGLLEDSILNDRVIIARLDNLETKAIDHET